MAKWRKIPKEELLRGLEEIEESLQNAVAEMETASRDGVIEAALFIATEAQKRAPVESGELKSSVHVDLNGERYALGNRKGDKVIAYGRVPSTVTEATIGFSAPHAAAQHEHTEFDHTRTDGYKILTGKNAGKSVNRVAGGQAKYLESVLVENKELILARIAGEMAEFFGGANDA